MYYKGEYYSDDDLEGMAESIGMIAEDCIWYCADGHVLKSEEIASWTNEMIIEMFEITGIPSTAEAKIQELLIRKLNLDSQTNLKAFAIMMYLLASVPFKRLLPQFPFISLLERAKKLF